MHALTLSIIFFVYTFASCQDHDLTLKERIDELKRQGKLWTKGRNKFFADMTDDELAMFTGARESPDDEKDIDPNASVKVRLLGGQFLPRHFDARNKWPLCKEGLEMIKNQSSMNCWAVASTSAMSDLTCIKCNGEYTPNLSQEDVATCCGSSCGSYQKGGLHYLAFDYWVNSGVVTGGEYGSKIGCLPNSVPHRPPGFDKTWPIEEPECKTKCQKSFSKMYRNDKHKGRDYGNVSGEVEMKNAIYNYGPITAAFKVYKDFQVNYTAGIYACPLDNTTYSYHAAKVIGWGESDTDLGNIPYWLAVNSWGTEWGKMGGLFKIVRGLNECGFEDHAVWGEASLDSCWHNN